MPEAITVRHPEFHLSDLPPRWVGGHRLATHFGNAGHVFIPLGEQFFVDTVKGFRDRLRDDDQRRAVNAFLGQEAVHKRTHEQMWSVLHEWGLPVAGYRRLISSIRAIERFLPAPFRLSVTAALEHYTAAFGHSFLTEDLVVAVPEEMGRLLAWHGLEELEHRAVAFDVLQAVDDSYVLRLAGFAFATGLIVVVPLAGTAMFALVDGRDRDGGSSASTPLLGMSARLARRMCGHLLDYLRPGFHPSDLDMPPEAGRWAELLDAPAPT